LLLPVRRKVTVPGPFKLPLILTLVVSEFGLTITTVKPAGLPPGAIDHAGTAGVVKALTEPVTLKTLVPNTSDPFTTAAARHCANGSVPALTDGV
jgi:hypothetical protein